MSYQYSTPMNCSVLSNDVTLKAFRRNSEDETDLFNFVSLIIMMSGLTYSHIEEISVAFPLALLAFSVSILNLPLGLEND